MMTEGIKELTGTLTVLYGMVTSGKMLELR